MNDTSTIKKAREELFDPGFLDRLRALFLRLRKRRQLRRKGLQSTPATGFTREFKDFRHYTPNDDYRSIDWRIYARLDRLFIRLYEEVQEFDIHVLIDTSASMAEPFTEKRRDALRLAVALCYLGLVSQHRVTLYTMNQGVKVELHSLKGQGSINRVIDHVLGLSFGGQTDLERCFKEFHPKRQRYGIIFLVSDLFGREAGSVLNALKSTSSWPGECHFIQVHHPWERRPDLDGEVELVDAETGEKRKIWFTKRDLERYQEAFDGFVESIQDACTKRQINHLLWSTELPFEDEFLQVLSRGSALAGSI